MNLCVIWQLLRKYSHTMAVGNFLSAPVLLKISISVVNDGYDKFAQHRMFRDRHKLCKAGALQPHMDRVEQVFVPRNDTLLLTNRRLFRLLEAVTLSTTHNRSS